MQAHFRILALLLLSLLFSQAIAATNDVAISLYNRWERLSSEQLMEMGARYRAVAIQPDSALVCFSIVANRYYQGHHSKDDIKHAIEAMIQIVWLYAEDFHDYAQATSYNLRARQLAEEHHYDNYLPYILINDANIDGMLESFSINQEFNEKNLDLQKKAFHLSLQQKNWQPLMACFMNLMIEASFHGKENLIEEEMNIIKTIDFPDDTGFLKYERCLVDGVRARANNQPDSALMYFKRLLDVAQNDMSGKQTIHNQITANNYIAEWYLAQHQDENYINTLKTIEQQSIESKNIAALLSNYKNFSDFYAERGNEQLAKHYHLLYLEGKDELVNKNKLGNANQVKFLYELNKKNDEVLATAQREHTKGRVMWGALVFSLVLLIVLALLWLNYRRVQERNRQLYNKSLEMLRADEEKRELIEQLQLSMPAEDVSPYAPSEGLQREGKLSAARQSDILHRVFMVMETSDEIYSPDFSLPRLAELVGDTRNNVSEAINQRYQGNFNALVNEYRVKEACRRINDRTQWSDYTLEAIGQSVGFKSRSTFWTVFKDIIGLTPGAYQQQSN